MSTDNHQKINADQLRRDGQDRFRRAIIAFQPDDLGIRIVLLEIENVLNIRPAPGINGLIRITHHADIPMLHRQRMHQHILRMIRILILIDHDVPEHPPIMFGNLRVPRNQLVHPRKHAVEVDSAIPLERALVVAPGQAVVCYDGPRVLGGGWIE